MSRYKFNEDEVPYAILEEFGLNQEMIEDLDMGLHDIYEVRITSLTPAVLPEQQVEVIVNILNQK
jgi:hypothetical protein